MAPDLGAPDRYAIPEARLKQYGFKDMHQFRNWRWYKGLGGGPIVDLGSHQIDIYSWFLGANPSHVMASGGLLYHDPKTHEWYDTVMVVYDYDTPLGPGEGVLPDADDQRQPGLLRELHGRPGDAAHLRVGGELRGPAVPRPERARLGRVGPEGIRQRARRSRRRRRRATPARLRTCASRSRPTSTRCRSSLRDPYHQPHLQNFFDAVRGKATLNCPAEIGYETAVSVLKVNEAIEAKSPAVVQARGLQDLEERGHGRREALAARPMIAITVLRVAGRLALPLRGHREADVALVVGGGLPEAGPGTVRRASSSGSPASRTCSPTPT